MNSASSAARFRLPVQPPLRQLLIASMSATVGSIEVIVWATFRLHGFVLFAGGGPHRGRRRLCGCRPGQVPVTAMGGVSRSRRNDRCLPHPSSGGGVVRHRIGLNW